MMKNWQTTLFGALAGVAALSTQFGLPPKYQAVAAAVSAIGVAGLGFVSKDAKQPDPQK